MNIRQVEMDSLFEQIGDALTYESSITVCGGSAIILAHKTRESTEDIDVIQCSDAVLSIANKICANRFHSDNWINDDVKVTQSYTPELLSWRTPYKKFNNLMVYMISGVALLCMKLRSFRVESNDLRDCKSLVSYCKMNGYTYHDVLNTYSQIYTSNSTMSVEADQFLRDYYSITEYKLDMESITSFVDMVNSKLISIQDIPKEFRSDVSKKLLENQSYALFVQNCLEELNSEKTYFDIKNMLPEVELPKDKLKTVLKTIA